MHLNLVKTSKYFNYGFIVKKAQSLSAHMRGCAKYKPTLRKEKPESSEICIETE